MKGRFWLSVVLWLAAIQVGKPQQNFETAPQAANSTVVSVGFPDVAGETHLGETNAIVRKKITVSGPLVQPFKTKRLRDVPKHLWHLVNPFAPAEPKPANERTSRLSTRAWSTTVGWTTGRSAFPDEVTHEPTMSLITLSRSE